MPLKLPLCARHCAKSCSFSPPNITLRWVLKSPPDRKGRPREASVMPQFSGCGPLASHHPCHCPVYLPLDSGKLDPTRPVGGERVPSLASWSLCCRLPQTRLPHMTVDLCSPLLIFTQPITPKESHSWRIRSSVWVTVQPLSLQGGRNGQVQRSHICPRCVVSGWSTGTPVAHVGDQASLQQRVGPSLSEWLKA